jgi:imidazolonepropionase-like amidohydrolase
MRYGPDGGAIMRSAKIVLSTLSVICACALAQPITPETPVHGKRIVIAASAVLDGKGRVLHNTRIAVEGSKIVAIDPKAGPVDYDLHGLTVLPGWIDAHVHITWSFGKDGKNAGLAGTTQEAAYQSASNAWVTLMAGFTTVQSVGSPTDAPLRDAIDRGTLPGPRILTALDPLQGRGEQTGTPDEIRAYVRKQKQAGADLIKIFASGGMLQGPMTLSQEQLNAACDEAKKQGLRTLVHAYFYCVINYTRKRQHTGQHGSCCTRNRAILIRSVAIDWGLCRWARDLRSSRPEVGRYRGAA